jgi:hypothetical protein
MDMIASYNDVGSYRGAAAICGVDHKTVKKAVLRQRSATSPKRATPQHNFDVVADVVAERVGRTSARISAKRLLPQAKAAGYAGSARNFRRLVPRMSGPGGPTTTEGGGRAYGRRARSW